MHHRNGYRTGDRSSLSVFWNVFPERSTPHTRASVLMRSANFVPLCLYIEYSVAVCLREKEASSMSSGFQFWRSVTSALCSNVNGV
jgi:hypothetical protein